MGTITNRDDGAEQANQAAVAERKRQIESGEVPPGIHAGDEGRLQTHAETQETAEGSYSSQDPVRIGRGRDRRTGEKR